MRKILIAGALLSAFSTSALAEVGVVYFKIDAGASMLTNPHSLGNYFTQKFDGLNTPFVNIGLGWTVMDNIRTDVNFSYHFNNKFTANALSATSTADGYLTPSLFATIMSDAVNYSALAIATGTVTLATDNAGAYSIPVAANGVGILGGGVHGAAGLKALGDKVDLATVTGVSVQDTLKTFSVMPRVYFDLFDYGGSKFFVGAALGYANVQYQSDVTVSYTAATQAALAAKVSTHNYIDAKVLTANPANQIVTLSSPTAANFAWGLHAGMDYKIPSWEGVKLNLEYSYTNYGQVKKLTVSKADVVLTNPINVNMNNLSLGLRVEM
jgi:hypothetical protein